MKKVIDVSYPGAVTPGYLFLRRKSGKQNR